MLYLIGDFASRTGLTARALRLYDALGLVPARRDPTNGHRYYTDDDLLPARRVRLLRGAGFSLRDIADLLSVLAEPGERDAVLEPFRARLKALAHTRAELADQEQTLRQLLDVLGASDDVRDELTRLAEVDPDHRRQLMQTIHERSATLSARGPRPRNEDHTHSQATASGGLYVVADGMGDDERGAEASARACEVVAEHLDPAQLRPDRWARHLEDLVDAANEAVLALREPGGSLGTTLAVLVLHEGVAYLTSVGDTRIYRHRDGALLRLTLDHSLIQGHLDAGTLAADDVQDHPDRHILTSAVGVRDGVPEVFVHREEIPPGSRYVLVSDGITRVLDDEDLAELLDRATDPAQAARSLVEAAETLTDDNATALVVDADSR
jgi:protein phosphatase